MNYEKLLGPIKLEAKRGYKNDSVIGGLDSFVLSYLETLDDKDLKIKLKKIFSDYGKAELEDREKKIKKAVELIEKKNGYTEENSSMKAQLKDLNTAKPNTSNPALNEVVRLSELFYPVKYVKGIGPALEKRLKKLNIESAYDLLFYFPRTYLDLRSTKKIFYLQNGEVAVLKVKILSINERKGKLSILTVLATDGSGYINAVWFNQPYLKNIFKEGMEVYLSGKVQFAYGKWEIVSPDYEIPQEGKELVHTLRIIPIYPLTEGVSQKTFRAKTKSFVDEVSSKILDYIDEGVLKRNDLISLNDAIKFIHFPPDFLPLNKAKERLIFDELFEVQYFLGAKKRSVELAEGYIFKSGEADIEEFASYLPFELTKDQIKVMREIVSNFNSGHPMNRLLHGDVGSGKTVVAFFSMFVSFKNHFQSVMMSPTEILAEQTYNNALVIFKHIPINVALLTASTSKKEKDNIKKALLSGEIVAVFGTHALLEESVQFANLGLAIVDEQHRFGVLQRGALKEKARIPHMLVMSATPIPRTLALTLYGDLDVSEIREMPKGRKPVITKVFYNEDERAYTLVKEELNKRHKAYIVCPLIEDSEALEVQSVESLFKRLSSGYLRGYKIGKLYGSMSGKEKSDVMDKFKGGTIQVIVSTTVVEVGVDVKDATVIVIEDADRFGLATLHQLRGRVGRSDLQSYCLLITRNPSKEAVDRLRVLEKTSNGFEVAEEDLRLRGPGEILGTKQSGLPEFRLTTLVGETDMKLLEIARKEAFDLLNGKAIWEQERLKEFKRILNKKFADKASFIEVG